MSLHSFVDESKEPSYLLVAAMIHPANLLSVRKVVASMNLPRQRCIHFNNERNPRRAQIISRLAAQPIEAIVVETKTKDEKLARRSCLGKLVADQLARDVRRLVIERDDSLVEFDRRFIRAELTKAADPEMLRYDHLRAHEEPLLSVPDAIAWCWAHGGHWRVKAEPLVVEAHYL